MAVERVPEGEAPSSTIASFGFSRTTIHKWINAAAKPGVGLKARAPNPQPGGPLSMTLRQEQQVFRWIDGKGPRQYGLVAGLWTRAMVADLIECEFSLRLGLATVGDLLAK